MLGGVGAWAGNRPGYPISSCSSRLRPNPGIRIFPLQRLKNFFAYCFHVCLRYGARRGLAKEAIYETFEYADTEFCVDCGVGQVNSGEFDRHDDPWGLLGSCNRRFVSIDSRWPRLIVYFEPDIGGQKRGRDANDEC
ncbi:MAG: hypothetical protein H8E62_00025, partial [Planctomycetes bacterium]|nr:hypothetical protein [Planctomycetota bacterium]